MRSQLNQIQQTLDVIVGGQQVGSKGLAVPLQDEDECFQFLPIKTDEDLEKVCKFAENDENRKHLVSRTSELAMI